MVTGDVKILAYPLYKAQDKRHPYYNQPQLDITTFVESIDFSSTKDESGIITGSITFRNPNNYLGILVDGSRILVMVTSDLLKGIKPTIKQSSYLPYIQLIINERDKDHKELQVQGNLIDRMSFLNQDSRDFSYTKSKKRPKGWTAHEIIRDVCTKNTIPFRNQDIPKTDIYIDKISATKVSTLAFFNKVLNEHNKRLDQQRKAALKKIKNEKTRKKEAKQFKKTPNWLIDFRSGTLVITPDIKATRMWLISEPMISESSYHESTKKMITEITVQGKFRKEVKKFNKDGKVAKRKKVLRKSVSVTVRDPQLAATYGVIQDQVKIAGSITYDQALKRAQAELKSRAKVIREFSFTCPFLPGIWPGSQLYLNVPSYGIEGIFKVTSSGVTISGADGNNMQIVVDAGTSIATAESTPKVISVTSVKKVGQHNDFDVIINYASGQPITIRPPKRTSAFKFVGYEIETNPDPADYGRLYQTVLIKRTNKKFNQRIPNRLEDTSSIVLVTDEGYAPISDRIKIIPQ